MDKIIEWLGQNKAWVLPGVGFSLITGSIGLIMKRRSRTDEKGMEINMAHHKDAIMKGKSGNTLTGDQE